MTELFDELRMDSGQREVNGRMDEWTDGRTDGRTDEQVDERREGRKSVDG